MAASLTTRIRRHYDRLAPFYRRFWGEHVHHGYWDDSTDPLEPQTAQERLIEVVAEAARLSRDAKVLDVGCGFGGSARWLAEHGDARVLGWTLSRTQARYAAAARVRVRTGAGAWLIVQADAETWPARAGAFDVVWIVECLEHLDDKPRAISAAARSLRPGGALALCTWMAGSVAANGLAHEVAEAFLCPALATPGEHARWAEDAGLCVEIQRDLTSNVRPTWEHVRRGTRRFWLAAAARFLDRDTRRFVRGFDVIARAYDEGGLSYHLLIARKPPGVGSGVSVARDV